MRPLLRELWQDERGSLLLAEWAYVATILILGILCAAVAVRSTLHSLPEDGGSGISAASSCTKVIEAKGP